MKALATLSNFLGCYDRWKEIVQKYQLSWYDNGNGGGLLFQRIEDFS
jgi:hypothetical protein